MGIQSSRLALYMYLIFRIRHVNTTLLDFSSSDLQQVPAAPEGMTVTTLNLKRNRIEELQQHAFRKYHSLTEIDLSFNDLRIIHDGVFDNITTLRKIPLKSNILIKLPESFGPSTTILDFIDLINAVANSRILSFPYFGAFIKLRALFIASVRNTNPNDSFYPPNIRLLGLNTGYMDAFPLLSSLTPLVADVYIQNNKIKSIPHEAIIGLFNLRLAYFDIKKIKKLPQF